MNTEADNLTVNRQKAKYGIDAPGVVRNLALACIFFVVLSTFFPLIKIGSVTIDTSGFIWTGISCGAGALLMLAYSLYGKFKHRDKMLGYVNWTGAEQVLDIGTGRGLLMIGAAKLLTTGMSTGIDIWNAEDLSGNKLQTALSNAAIEGVSDKIVIKNENATNMSFADNSFDVILSNMCIHNIYTPEGRKTACAEIARVLKDGGTAIISDWRHVKEYSRNFKELQLQTQLIPANYLTTFPAVNTVIVKKKR